MTHTTGRKSKLNPPHKFDPDALVIVTCFGYFVFVLILIALEKS